jgi:hypothetical protein
MDKTRSTRRLVASLLLGGAATLLAGASPAFAAEPHPDMGAGGGGCSSGLIPETVTPIYSHFEKAHLERSPTQQGSDIQATGDYVALHQAWIESFTSPGLKAVPGAGQDAAAAFQGHMQKAHVERTPTDQVADLSDADNYVQLHTVLIEAMTQSLFTSLSACG